MEKTHPIVKRLVALVVLATMALPAQLSTIMVAADEYMPPGSGNGGGAGGGPPPAEVWFKEIDITPPPVNQPFFIGQGIEPLEFQVRVLVPDGGLCILLMSHRAEGPHAFDYDLPDGNENNPVPPIPEDPNDPISGYVDILGDSFKRIFVTDSSGNPISLKGGNPNGVPPHSLPGWQPFVFVESTSDELSQDVYTLHFQYDCDDDESVMRIMKIDGYNERILEIKTEYIFGIFGQRGVPKVDANHSYIFRFLTDGYAPGGGVDFYIFDHAKADVPGKNYNELVNAFKRNQNGDDYQIVTSTDVYGNTLYFDGHFCYKVGNFPTMILVGFDVYVVTTTQNNYADSSWDYWLLTSGWDDPKTHDYDGDGLSDYVEADLGTYSDNSTNPNIAYHYVSQLNTFRYSWTKSTTAEFNPYPTIVINTYAVDTTFVIRRGSSVEIYGDNQLTLRAWDSFDQNQGDWPGLNIVRDGTHWDLSVSTESPVGIVKVSIGRWAGGQWQSLGQYDLLVVFDLPSLITEDELEAYGYSEVSDYCWDPDNQSEPWVSSRDRCENTAFYNWWGDLNESQHIFRQYTYHLKPFELQGPGLKETSNMEYRSAYLATGGAHGATSQEQAAVMLSRIVTQRMVWNGGAAFDALHSDRRSYWYTGEYPDGNNHVLPLTPTICHSMSQNGNIFPGAQAPMTYYGRGQCFDFAAILTSFLRGVGIPSRAVSGVNTGDGNDGRHMWTNFHTWTEMFLDYPPPVPNQQDNWFVVDSSDEWHNGNFLDQGHIEDSMGPRIDYYKSWKVKNNHYPDSGGLYTDYLGDHIMTAPTNWVPRWVAYTSNGVQAADHTWWSNDYGDGFAPSYQRITDHGGFHDSPPPFGAWKAKQMNDLLDVKVAYTNGENTHLQLLPGTSCRMLTNDFDCYQFTPQNVHTVNFTLNNINPNDPANNDARLYISTITYARNATSADFGTLTVGQNSQQMQIGMTYYITITTGLWVVAGNVNVVNDANNAPLEGNHYQYTINIA